MSSATVATAVARRCLSFTVRLHVETIRFGWLINMLYFDDVVFVIDVTCYLARSASVTFCKWRSSWVSLFSCDGLSEVRVTVASLTSVGVVHRLCLFEASAPVVPVERDLNVCDVVMLCSCWIKAACAS